jgi:hypothetical protein
MSKQVKSVEDNQPAKVKERILPVVPPYELVQKLLRLNQKCLRQRKLSLNELKNLAKELTTNTVEKNEKRTQE